MNEKQQQLTFDKGITNVPSDALCSDNALEESVGMIYDNGEHRVIQKPVVADLDGLTLSAGETLIYVHSYNGVTRLVVRYTETDGGGEHHHVGYKCMQNGTQTRVDITEFDGEKVLAESIGNTLIVSTSAGLNYLLWDYTNSVYKNLGSKLPDITVGFTLDEFDDDQTDWPFHYIRMDGMVEGVSDGMYAGNKFVEGQYDNARTALIGLVASRLRTVKEKGRFAFPFWARFAIRMYDGSHINISNPYLLMPSVLNNWEVFVCNDNGEFKTGYLDDKPGGWPQTNYKPVSAELKYKVSIPNGVNIDDWDDVISGVDIFVSEEMKNFDMEGDWKILNSFEQGFPGGATVADSCEPKYTEEKNVEVFVPNNPQTNKTYYMPTNLKESDIFDGLIGKSQFYKILELDIDEIKYSNANQPIKISDKITRNALVNLTTQTQLEYDDYFGRTNIVPQVMKTYNHRLHMANISRDFFGGFTDFSFTRYANAGDSDNQKIFFYTYIKSESGERIVESETSSLKIPEIVDIWFYYPDPRAYKVEIYEYVYPNIKLIDTLSLKEHPYLHGAYYFKRLPTTGESYTSTVVQDYPTTNGNVPELLRDQLVVSEVDNPYIFTAKGYTNVGMGMITGLATQTMALDENEHGIHPMTVFSEKGISLLRLNNEGVYLRSDEISREVANPDNPCIIETDGPVYFASKRGLMVLVGQQVKCVSEQLGGRESNFTGEIQMGNFCDYLKDCFIAYDYRDSLLWLFNNSRGSNNNYCYIYSIKSGTFGKYTFANPVTNVVSNYPDYLLQAGNTIYSLLDRQNINTDSDTYSGTIITRPMKLESALALKSIMQVRHITDMEGSIALKIYASNNLKGDWVQLTSLRGRPWKYYRFRYDFTNMAATDRFAGTMLITQERRTDKLR